MARFKKAECKVLKYNQKTHTADVDFKGHGIRVHGVGEEDIGDTLTLMYCGKIGTPDFQYKLPCIECADTVTND